MTSQHALTAGCRLVVIVFAAIGACATAIGAQSEQLRESWQRVPELFAAAGVREGAHIADVGSGDAQGVSVLRHLYDALKPGGSLVLCEPTPRAPNQPRAAHMNDHVLDPVRILEDLRAAGFQVLERRDAFATNLGGTHFGFVLARVER